MIGFNILELHKTYAGLAESIHFLFSKRFRHTKRKQWQSEAGRRLTDVIGYALSYLLITLIAMLLMGLLFRGLANEHELILKATQEPE